MVCSLLPLFANADTSGTTFIVDDDIFSITNFYTWDYSTIHFGIWNTGNSFWWAIFWWPMVNKDVELVMNWSSIYCKRQLRWLYINQVRWNVLWPLDQSTMRLLKWNFVWYQNLSMSGWFFTHCTWDLITDYNWIYWYINHRTTDGVSYGLWAWFKYTNQMFDVRGDSLWYEYDLLNRQSYIKWVLFDSYGGLWFINTGFNHPLILRNITWNAVYVDLDITPKTTSIWWELQFDVNFWNNWDLYIDRVKVYVTIPNNIQVDRNNIWIQSGNSLLIYDDKLYPLQSRHFSFVWKAVDYGNFTSTWSILVDSLWYTDIATGSILNTKINVKQKIYPDRAIIVNWKLRYEIEITNDWNVVWNNMKLYNYLPDRFHIEWDYDIWDDNSILLYTWNLLPWSGAKFTIKWYFSKVWTYVNTLKATSDNLATVTNELSVDIVTNICGNGKIEKDYEYCDDWDDNGKRWYCNSECSDLVNYWLACKYTDANYLKNWPFEDTIKHWASGYIETMRLACLHRWKWTFAWQRRYDPDEYVTKAEVLKTLVKIRWIVMDDFDIQNEDMPYNWVQVFEDVKNSHWFSWYSFYAFDHDMTDGLYTIKNGKKYLNPDGAITRNEMIKATMNLYKEIIDSSEIKIIGPSNMKDVEKWNLYYEYVREAEELWIISWYDMPNGSKMWQWNNYLTRAEFAKIISIPFEDVLFDK